MVGAVKKAVFPVAGLGTRFLPATKANPKEMLPIVDKPLIQYAVEEAIAAGIKELIFITSGSKRSIEDHFDTNFELERTLIQREKTELLSLIKNILPEDVNCIYLRQKEALGLGHAVLCAKPVVNDEPFAVVLADDLFLAEAQQTLKDMVALYGEHQAGIIGVEKVVDTEKYGIVAGDVLSDGLIDIKTMVEKPPRASAPSNLAVAGRYVLPPEIFGFLETIEAGYGGEIQLTDAIAALLAQQRVLAYQFPGKRYDCGSKLGYLKATIACALLHPEVADEFKQYLASV